MNKRKAYGQHFLINKGVADKVVAAIPENLGKRVLEVGPGRGFLTRRLLENDYYVVGMEKDENLVKYLETLELNNFHLLQGDILEISFEELVDKYELNGVVANLPYSISTRFVEKLIRENPSFNFLVLMFQKEVAEKLISPPGSRETGPLSIALQHIYKVEKMFVVKPGSFAPPPSVDSEVIRLVRKRDVDKKWINRYLDFLFRLFSKRRKKIRSVLRINALHSDRILDKRAEELSEEEILFLFSYFN